MPAVLRSARIRVVLPAVTLMLACAPAARSQARTDFPSVSPLLNPRLDTLVVARVGPWTIPASEFVLGYDLGPAFVKRVTDSRRRYLNFLINEKLLALGALERGLDGWPDVRRQTREIEADLATEELYRQDVLPGVTVGERAVARGVEQDRMHVEVRWLFAATAEGIGKALAALRSGATFDSLFERQLRDGVTRDDRTMSSTRFRIRTENPAFATVIDTLRPGHVSIPVHGPDGWYLVQLTDAWVNPILTQSEEAKLRENVRTALTQHAADSLSDRYVRRMMEELKPTIIRHPFNAIEAHLGLRYLTADTIASWGFRALPGVRDIADLSDLSAIGARALVRMKRDSLTVRDFLEWFRMREPYVRIVRSTPQAFFGSVEDLVWRMVRDRMLTRRAFARGFQKRPAVTKQTQWWQEKMLYLANKQRIGDSIVDSLPALQRYYEEHRRQFADSTGSVRPFADVRDDVWRQYYADELRARMLHEVLRLKEKFGVRIDDAALKSLQVDEENDPRAIDVYPAKTGGIYPRQAFPSIDYDWQSWN